MKVWLVFGGRYEHIYCCGVFSTEELAYTCQEELEKRGDYSHTLVKFVDEPDREEVERES